MKETLLELLRCPRTNQKLRLTNARWASGEIESATLVTEDRSLEYPVVRFLPRFVPSANYAANFTLQWQHFRRTQLDSNSGRPISRNRFYGFTDWRPDELSGRRVLDVGCGAGRFTEIALDAGAEVFAIDYSGAV